MINRNVSWEIVFCTLGRTYGEVFLLGSLVRGGFGGYSYIYRRDKPRLLITYPLLVVEPWLPRDMFRRVHRSCIVNLRAMEGFIGKAICIADRVLPVSPLYREEVFGCFLFWELKRKKKVQ